MAPSKRLRKPQPLPTPQWLEESQNQQTCGHENFKLRRVHILRMSEQQLATWLKVTMAQVTRWENGKSPIPFAVFEAMRLLAESITYQRQNDTWAGWRFSKFGELVSPDGTLIFTVDRLMAVANSFRMAGYLEVDNQRLSHELQQAQQEVEALKQENEHLREMVANDGVLSELHTIKNQVETLLNQVDRGRVYAFPLGKVAA